jgi:hypothetical protein
VKKDPWRHPKSQAGKLHLGNYNQLRSVPLVLLVPAYNCVRSISKEMNIFVQLDELTRMSIGCLGAELV